MKNSHSAWLAFVFNPLVLFIYGLVCSNIALLAQYGGLSTRAPIVLSGSLLLLIWWFWSAYRSIKYRQNILELPIEEEVSTGLSILSKWWNAVFLLAFVFITFTTGRSVYQSAVNMQGKLAFYIDRWQNTRHIEYTHDNLYKDGVAGVLQDIQEELTLPEELYVANEFEATFDQDGDITSLYGLVYGMNEDNETESFLIDYDRSKSDALTVHLNGYVEPVYDERMLLQPLVEITDLIPVQEVVSQWEEETYGIYYAGVRDWGYNTEGLVSVETDGNVEKVTAAPVQLIGYTVSVHAPENASVSPVRFVEFTPQFLQKFAEEKQTETSTATDTFFMNQKLGYRLTVADAALGSRFYVLEQTTDGGKNWETLNADPFSGTLGTASGITFIDEQLGFIGLSRSGGSSGELYRTTDGGLTFELVTLPEIDVPLSETESYAPFDFPEMPYEGTNHLMLLVHQGQDGDYNGGSKGLFRSSDQGETWEYVEEIH
ncbi:WD40/YVTN/BNR-like repeat-containing protein [Atopococcus tabaci]|uniref:WD40/YVTN/BNR-like repeat-containing protein n=1 Tax=Atopococcus tabaci TaxID=269774 RepID=UPI00240966FB|nr:hypothetical protein [Atopococcus tabaci]